MTTPPTQYFAAYVGWGGKERMICPALTSMGRALATASAESIWAWLGCGPSSTSALSRPNMA
jgi:hypothetical protein